MPHVSLGMFARRGEEYELRDPTAVRGDDARYAAALAEAEALGIDYRCTLDRLMPVTPTDDFSRADLGPDLR